MEISFNFGWSHAVSVGSGLGGDEGGAGLQRLVQHSMQYVDNQNITAKH